ncbi:MAG: methyltransferase domain-containing protein [Pseudomonadota bacterium]
MSSLRVRYQTIEFDDVDIHVRTLRDNQQYSDDEGVAEKLGISSATWPIFGVVWDSGRVLAYHMLKFEIKGKRILEVGCGIALASLVLNQRLADITSTDYHPEAENFLLENIRLNKGKHIPFVRTGWLDGNDTLGMFDLIIGSDVLYERDHVDLLADFIQQHTKHHCEVIIVDPGRCQRGGFSRKMSALGFSHIRSSPPQGSYLSQPFRGQILCYTR